MKRLIQVLTVAGWISGLAVIGYGIARYFQQRNIPSLLIALAVVIVGPLEDVLKGWVRRKTRVEEEPLAKIVDLSTSVTFLILLLVVVYLIP